MPERARVRVHRFADRKNLVLLWRDPATGRVRTRSAGTADPARAEELRADLEYELNHGGLAGGEKITWARFRQLFEEEHLAARRPNTRNNYRVLFDHFERIARPAGLRGVSERTVSAFAAALRSRPCRGSKAGMCAATVHRMLGSLRAALRWAAGQGLIAACPKFPHVKVPKKRPQPVPAEAVEKLLAAAPDADWRAYLLCAWCAGLRRDEARRLEWAPSERRPWLDLGRDRVVLPAEAVKGCEDQWVPLDPLLKAALLALPRRGRRVFRLTWGGEPCASGSAVSGRVGDIARKAGVRLSYRALRRGFACRYAGKVPAQVLQRLMRHSNIATTVAYYANLDAAVEEAVLGKRPAAVHNEGVAPSPPE